MIALKNESHRDIVFGELALAFWKSCGLEGCRALKVVQVRCFPLTSIWGSISWSSGPITNTRHRALGELRGAWLTVAGPNECAVAVARN